MKYAVIEAGAVVNMVLAPSLSEVHLAPGQTALLAGDNAEMGGTHDGTLFVRRPAPAPETPEAVSKLQLVRAMRTTGLWGDFKAAIAQADLTTKEDWEYAYQINRGDPLVQALMDTLGLNPADMDDLFITGETL